MQKDKHKTKIRFVYPRYPDGQREVLAVFMGRDAGLRYAPGRTGINGIDGKPFTIKGQWLRQCYARIGQHAECSDGFQKRTRATPEQYAPLLRELESIGYNVEVV